MHNLKHYSYVEGQYHGIRTWGRSLRGVAMDQSHETLGGIGCG